MRTGKWSRGADYVAAFVFAYRVAQVEVDYDGREAFPFGADRYLFFAVRAADYRRCMKRRSPRWKTVTLAAEDFRRCVVDPANLVIDPMGPAARPAELPE